MYLFHIACILLYTVVSYQCSIVAMEASSDIYIVSFNYYAMQDELMDAFNSVYLRYDFDTSKTSASSLTKENIQSNIEIITRTSEMVDSIPTDFILIKLINDEVEFESRITDFITSTSILKRISRNDVYNRYMLSQDQYHLQHGH